MRVPQLIFGWSGSPSAITTRLGEAPNGCHSITAVSAVNSPRLMRNDERPRGISPTTRRSSP